MKMKLDANEHKFSGNVCDNVGGKPIIWNGHACEGADLTAPAAHNFCLWTKCKNHDVPANAAHDGNKSEITCPKCLEETK